MSRGENRAAADTSQLVVPGSGSLLASYICGFGEAGQRWLVQLKPDPLYGVVMSEIGGRHIVAAMFGILGVATIALGALAILLGRSGDPGALSIGLLYGITAVLTSYGLWNRKRLAPKAFLAWCSTIVLFMSAVFFDDPGLADPWLIPSGILLFAVFYFGWRKIRSVCAPAV
jgi:hypothetical protein